MLLGCGGGGPAMSWRKQAAAAAASQQHRPQRPAASRRALVNLGNLVNGWADRCGRATKQHNQKRRVKPEVIVLGSDSERKKKDPVKRSQKKKDPVKRSQKKKDPVKRSQKKKDPVKRAAFWRATIRTLTSIMTNCCDRASNGTISSLNWQARTTYDIDSSDANNELAVVEYVEDIHKSYKSIEGTCRPLCTYMSSQSEIDETMRAILIDWVIEAHQCHMLTPETLYLTVYIIDQFLSMEDVSVKELQLIGLSAMLIASKYEESIRAPSAEDFLVTADNAFTREQALGMEMSILNKLDWNLTVPTTYVFTVRYLKAAAMGGGDKELENMAFFYTELALVEYSMLVYSPSMTAAAAVYAARSALGMCPLWHAALEHHTGVAEPLLLECARRLASLHSTAGASEQKAVYDKYCDLELGAVSLHSPAKKLLPLAGQEVTDRPKDRTSSFPGKLLPACTRR